MTAGLEPARVGALFEAAGFGPFTGVPCSFLGPVISYLQHERPDRYLTAANEGEAVAIAAGARLSGQHPVVILQNSGLGNAVNPLASLCHTLRLPVLLLVTWRGQPGRPDEPQHQLMGRITADLLTALEVRNEILPGSLAELRQRLQAARAHMHATGQSFAFVVPKGAIAPYAAPSSPSGLDGTGQFMLRSAALGHVLRAAGEKALVIATTGKTARELERDWDRAGNLYVVGSMGCASSVALGVALNAPGRPVIVLDGDGAALMRLEAMATIGRLGPPNLLHIILDNRAYESTGGQPTGSQHVDFPGIALACGYRCAVEVTSAEGLRAELSRQLAGDGPALLRVRVAAYSDPGLGRPSLPPPASAARFAQAVAS
jgi:phosphonopyruvate decarboxylase